MVAVLAAAAPLAGCGGSPFRFDALPGPITTVDVAVAASGEQVPLSADEWSAVDHVLDGYLADFERLRGESIAPLVLEARRSAGDDLSSRADALARLRRRHATVLARIEALDVRFASDLTAALPARAGLAGRIAVRRSIDRAATVIEGLGDGSGRSPTLLDLEASVRALRLGAAETAAIEPALATYRSELARAGSALAAAVVEHPAEVLAAKEAAGVTDAAVAELASRAGESEEAKQALAAAREQLAQAERRAQRPLARAHAAVDDANRRGLEACCALLAPEAADRLRDLDAMRRTSDDGWSQAARFGIEVLALHPEVRSGQAARTARLLGACREALAEVLRAHSARRRAALGLAAAGGPAVDLDPEGRIRDMEKRLSALGDEVRAAAREELRDGTVDTLEQAGRLTPEEMVERLSPAIGRSAAERMVRATVRTAFRSDREEREPEWNGDLSIAEQLLLAPGMDHGAFRRAARAIGARDDDPMVEQIWDRHQARAASLETRQREQMRVLEAQAMESARDVERDPEAFERRLAGYLQALLAADGDRRDADDETFREVAIALGLPDDDARFTLARAVSSARRASLPWRRFRQPWLLGALWESDADPVSTALGIEQELDRDAALVVLAAHAVPLREAADRSRRAGLEALRDFLLFGVQARREGRTGDPQDYLEDLALRKIVDRVEQAGKDRRRAQRAALEAVAAISPELGDRFMEAWARETFPQFWNDGPAWREAASLAEAGADPSLGDAAQAVTSAAAGNWRDAQPALVRRLARWQDGRRSVPAPANAADLSTAAAMDPELASLCTERDEPSWRLLRTASVAAGLPPAARLRSDGRAGALPRPAAWTP